MRQVIILASVLLGLLGSLLVVRVDYQAKVERDDASMIRELAKTRSRIEEGMFRYFTLVEALEAFVHAEEDLYEQDNDLDSAFKPKFDVFVKSLESNSPGIGSLQLAPQGIVTFVSQEERNAKAIGHDLLKDPKRRAQVLRTIIDHSTVLAGPINLVQGGTAIIARKAIYTRDGAFDRKGAIASGRAALQAWPNQVPADFWGFATMLIHVEPLYKELGLMDLPKHYEFAIRGRHALGAEGEIFWGDAEVFDQPRFTSEIMLPGGSWVIGIKNSQPQSYLRPGLFTLVGLLMGALVGYGLVSRQDKLEARAEASAQSRFLAVMSHEIRTPMNGIIGMSELLQRSELNNRQQDQADQIVVSSKVLLRLVNDILDFSKIDAKSMELEHTPYSIKAVINDVVGSVEQIANSNGVKIVTVINDSVPDYMMGDAHRMQQVLTNLLSNAVKFTHDGSILVVASMVPGHPDSKLSILVKDTGIGMTDTQVKKLFQPFTQADQSVTRRYGGTGLGLVICRHLVVLMGGNISVRSEPDQGTEFEVFIPYFEKVETVEKGDTAEPVEVEQEVKQSAVPQQNNEEIKAEHRDLKILVVDDNAMNIVVAEMILEELGYTLDKADSGLAAIAAVQQKDYDIIYMDRQMPEMDGLEATRSIRELSQSNTQPWIVGFTASAQESEKQEYLAAGANDFLSKPIETEYMDRTIRRFFDQA